MKGWVRGGYKPEGSGFDSRRGHWDFFRPHYGPGVESTSNTNEG